jgi:hypothetical protein
MMGGSSSHPWSKEAREREERIQAYAKSINESNAIFQSMLGHKTHTGHGQNHRHEQPQNPHHHHDHPPHPRASAQDALLSVSDEQHLSVSNWMDPVHHPVVDWHTHVHPITLDHYTHTRAPTPKDRAYISERWAEYNPPMPPNYDLRQEEAEFQQWFRTYNKRLKKPTTKKPYQGAPSYHPIMHPGSRAKNKPAP